MALTRSTGPRVQSTLNSGGTAKKAISGSIPGATEYYVGRPKPRPFYHPAALFNYFSSDAPRSTMPWYGGPKQFVGPTGPPTTEVYLGNPGDFVAGNSAWRSGGGFPHGDAWPGWPDDWETPYFSTNDHNKKSILVSRVVVCWSCIDLISRLLATMPIKITKNSRPWNQPAWIDNPEPLLYASVVDFIKQLVNSMLTRGETFLLITAWYADGLPARFFVVNPDLIKVVPLPDGTNEYTLKINGQEIPLDPEVDLLHIRYQTAAGMARGIGPLEASASSIASAEAMQSYSGQMSGRGGVPNAVIQSETSLTKDQIGGIKRSWRQMIATNGSEPVVLTKGLQYQALSLNAKELALLDHRVFDEQRIASAYGVPPFLVGLPAADSATYSNNETVWDFFWRSTLRPLGHNIAMAMSQWLLPSGVYMQFVADELVRPPIKTRAETYDIMIRNGIMTRDEARIEEGLFPLGNDQPAPVPNVDQGNNGLNPDQTAQMEVQKEGRPG